MFPGINQRQLKQAMKKMGIAQQDISANEVIIKCDDMDIVITNPQVAKVNMMGQETFQITGNIEERAIDTTPEISEDDIKTVVEQTNVSQEVAKKTIIEAKGDLAEAIMKLKEN
jgi:nascent polypeptide-associated complex subunit alpha